MNKKYYVGLISFVAGGRKHDITREYVKLTKKLNSIPFRYTISGDANRVADALSLRNRYLNGGFEHNFDYKRVANIVALRSRYLDDATKRVMDDEDDELDDKFPETPSVLEVMIALAVRLEETIMDDPEFGDRTGEWFDYMLKSLGLSIFKCSVWGSNTEQAIDKIVNAFLDREYDRKGYGGLFYIPDIPPKIDLSKVEIWYQALWYLDSIT